VSGNGTKKEAAKNFVNKKKHQGALSELFSRNISISKIVMKNRHLRIEKRWLIVK
jgi:hypothetical protein